MRLLPERHDHDDGRAAQRQSRSGRDRNPRGATLQSLPLRRACRDSQRCSPRGGRHAQRPGFARMSVLQEEGRSRADYIDRDGTLAMVRAQGGGDVNAADASALDLFVLVEASGRITAFHGHVDLGTGIRTALAQIVAEELDVDFDRVRVVLGDTSVTPDFGPTIASETIQVTSAPLRCAAAQARQRLVEMAAARLGANADDLVVNDGLVGFRNGDNRSISYGELLDGERIRIALRDDVALKPVADYRIVGQSQPRVDLVAKATG